MKSVVEERTPYTLGAEVIGVILKHPSSVEEITVAVFHNLNDNNQHRVWKTVNGILKHGAIIPVYNGGVLRYRYNFNGVDKKQVVEGVGGKS